MKENGKVANIFLSGVGGQGAILASNILAEVFLNAGYDVKKAEVHVMAQRGGDVTTHFRFGKKVYSPLIKQGDVDFLLSFELLEAIKSLLAPKLHDLNVRAFYEGKKAMSKMFNHKIKLQRVHIDGSFQRTEKD